MKNEIIVVSGGIGLGKSTFIKAINEFSEVKVDFFSFDDFTKELFKRSDVQDFLMIMFGTTDQLKISDMVFKHEALLQSLNEFLFQFVEEKFLELVNTKHHHPLVIEFPMFFEVKEISDAIKFVRDKFKVVLITADDSVRINRVKHRNNFTEEKIKNIMAAQMSQEKKAVLADYVVDTSNQETKHAAEQLMKNKFKKVFFSAQMV